MSDDQVDPDEEAEDVDEASLPADEVEEEFSLDNLGEAYAKAAAEHDPDSYGHLSEQDSELDGDDEQVDDGEPALETESDEEHEVATPEAIVEAALFVGHPENKSFSEQRLASLMRDVSPDEVIEIIDQLNDSYRSAGQALRIVKDDRGYRMTIAPAVEGVRRSFLGKVREARLSQSAIEVLALVAYQPGITSQTVQDQRGRESGSLLTQLVRRQLLEMRREKPADGGRSIPHYYPTERFLTLFGLESLDELPQVEEHLHGA